MKVQNKKSIGTRGRTFTGIVTSDKMSKTVTVEWERRKHIPKYERFAKRRSRVKAHNPEEINAKVGDMLLIKETRPLSKTKKFIVVKILSQEETITQQKIKEKTQHDQDPKKKAAKKEETVAAEKGDSE